MPLATQARPPGPPAQCSEPWSTAVVLVNYNSGEHLRRSLAAACQQTCHPRRVIVVDNASSDESLAGIQTLYPKVELVQAGRNLGFAAANNLAIEMAGDCAWIALLNVDAYAAPDWLEKLLAAAQARPEVSFLGSKLLMASDPRILDGTGDVYHVSGRAWRRHRGLLAGEAAADSAEVLAPCAAAALYRRDALREIGGFDESFFCYFEDVDLGFRLRLAGHRYAYVPEAVVRHVGSATTVEHSDFSVYHGQRNLVWTYFKNMPAPLFWLFLPQHLLLNLAALIWFSLRGQMRVIFRAKWDAFLGLPSVWQARRRVQQHRKASLGELRGLLSGGWLRPYSRAPR